LEKHKPQFADKSGALWRGTIAEGGPMKKPINKLAVALWIVAIVYAAGEVWSLCSALRFAGNLQGTYGGHSYIVTGTVWKIAQSIVLVCSQLIALGILIEMVDQIRWNSINRKT
jgi:hypothetical protein